MPQETHWSTTADNEIDNYEEYCSFIITSSLLFAEVVGIYSEEWHSETTSSDGTALRENCEKNTNKYCRPYPQIPCPFLSMCLFDNSANKEEENNITKYMQDACMEKTIENHLFNKTKNIGMMITYSSMKNYIGIKNIKQCSYQRERRYSIYRAFPINTSPVRKLDVYIFHKESICFSLILQREEYHILYEKYLCREIHPR